jgi:hypothetical protein
MSIIAEFLDKLPEDNQIAISKMLEYLSEDDVGFIEDYLLFEFEIPTNILDKINHAFRLAGHPQFCWENCLIDKSGLRFSFD